MHSAGGAKVMQTNHHFKIVEWPVASWWNTTDIDCSIVEGVCSGTRWEVWIPVLIFPAGYQGLSLVYVRNHSLRERCWLRVNFLSAKGKAVTWLKLASPKEERPMDLKIQKGLTSKIRCWWDPRNASTTIHFSSLSRANAVTHSKAHIFSNLHISPWWPKSEIYLQNIMVLPWSICGSKNPRWDSGQWFTAAVKKEE